MGSWFRIFITEINKLRKQNKTEGAGAVGNGEHDAEPANVPRKSRKRKVVQKAEVQDTPQEPVAPKRRARGKTSEA